MKKVLVAVIVSMLIGVAFAEAVMANPKPQVTPSYEPIIIPPEIKVELPKNDTEYNVNKIEVVFNVTAPKSVNATHSCIFKIYCLKDWAIDKSVLSQYVYIQNLTNNEHLAFKEISLTLTEIPVGNHSIEIGADGAVVCPEGKYSFQHTSDSKTTIYFTIEPSTKNPDLNNSQELPQSTFQVIEISSAIIIVVIISVALLYRRHRRTAYLSK